MEPIIIAITVAGAITIIWLLFMGTMIVLTYRAHKRHNKGMQTWMSRLLARLPIIYKNMERLNAAKASAEHTTAVPAGGAPAPAADPATLVPVPAPASRAGSGSQMA